MTPSASPTSRAQVRSHHPLQALPAAPTRVALHSTDPLERIGLNAALRALASVEVVSTLAHADVVILSVRCAVPAELPPTARLILLTEDLSEPEATPHRLLEAIMNAHDDRQWPTQRRGRCQYFAPSHAQVQANPARLSEREAEILRLLADGLETPQIALQIAYADRTVKNILHNLLSRLNLRNRSHAVAYALRHGLI